MAIRSFLVIILIAVVPEAAAQQTQQVISVGWGMSLKYLQDDPLGEPQDECPADPQKTAAGGCGCGVEDRDSDFDETLDCIDACPSDWSKYEPGVCGCGAHDFDSDFDGVPDCIDSCPWDRAKDSPAACGCGFSDADDDANGITDCLEMTELAVESGVSESDMVSSRAVSALSDIPAEVRDELSSAGFSPLLLVGDVNGDGLIDLSDSSIVAAGLADGHVPSLCERLTWDISGDGVLSDGDVAALERLVEISAEFPNGKALRRLRGQTQGCPVFPIAVAVREHGFTLRVLSGDAPPEAYQIESANTVKTLTGLHSSENSVEFAQTETAGGQSIHLSFAGGHFMLFLNRGIRDISSAAEVHSSLLDPMKDQQSDAQAVDTLPPGVLTAPNPEGGTTLWLKTESIWERLKPTYEPLPHPTFPIFSIPKQDSACATLDTGPRIGSALLFEFLADWRLSDDSLLNLNADLQDAGFRALSAATRKLWYNVLELNLSTDPRTRARPKRMLGCAGFDSNSRPHKGLVEDNDEAPKNLGDPCEFIVQLPKPGNPGSSVPIVIHGVVHKELQSVEEHARTMERFNADLIAMSQMVDGQIEKFEYYMKAYNGGIFVYVSGHGARPKFKSGSPDVPEHYGYWHDGLGMFYLFRDRLLDRVVKGARGSCNLTVLDNSCFSAAALYARTKAASCSTRPARFSPVEEEDQHRHDIVNSWLDVGHAWRSVTHGESLGRIQEVTAALKQTSELRLNRALRNGLGGTGNFGDAHLDKGYNDPDTCERQ